MSGWSTDKIVGVGLVIALIISIVASAMTGIDGEKLQTTLATGLIGFIGRVGYMGHGITEAAEHRETPKREKKEEKESDCIGKSEHH
jgi:hypothetical protein